MRMTVFMFIFIYFMTKKNQLMISDTTGHDGEIELYLFLILNAWSTGFGHLNKKKGKY